MKYILILLSILFFSCSTNHEEKTSIFKVELVYFNGDVETNEYTINYHVEVGDNSYPEFRLNKGDLISEYHSSYGWEDNQIRSSYVRKFRIIEHKIIDRKP